MSAAGPVAQPQQKQNSDHFGKYGVNYFTQSLSQAAAPVGRKSFWPLHDTFSISQAEDGTQLFPPHDRLRRPPAVNIVNAVDA